MASSEKPSLSNCKLFLSFLTPAICKVFPTIGETIAPPNAPPNACLLLVSNKLFSST